MHGVTTNPDDRTEEPLMQSRARLRDLLWRRRFYLVLVILPTLLTALYFAVVATNQYEAEAHVIVRSAATSGASSGGSGLSQMLGLAGGSKATSNTSELVDFLESMDAMQLLTGRVNLVEAFRRPEADLLSRLPDIKPTQEDLYKFYKRQVDIQIDAETGIAGFRARGFRPADSLRIVEALVEIGEQRVNSLNERSRDAALDSARRQLSEAEKNGRQVERELSRFRNVRSDIDPQSSGEAQTRLVTELTQQLVLARAQLSGVVSMIGTNNPQYQTLNARVNSLQQQVAAQGGRLVGGDRSIAASLEDYAELKLRQDFAGRRYEAAAGALEKAREEIMRQQLFVTRLVEPSLPQKSLHPKGLKNTVTVFLLLTILYGIGWLLLAGVREHAQ
jgi:capsular polysaccharide transport system permease protein